MNFPFFLVILLIVCAQIICNAALYKASESVGGVQLLSELYIKIHLSRLLYSIRCGHLRPFLLVRCPPCLFPDRYNRYSLQYEIMVSIDFESFTLTLIRCSQTRVHWQVGHQCIKSGRHPIMARWALSFSTHVSFLFMYRFFLVYFLAVAGVGFGFK